MLREMFSGFGDREHKTTKGVGFEVHNNCFMKTKFCFFVDESHKRPSMLSDLFFTLFRWSELFDTCVSVR